MALHGAIKVNGQHLGSWSAVRRSGQVEPTPNTVLTYDVAVSVLATLQGNPPIWWEGAVEHRFGDGALGLAALVLSKAQQMSGAAR